MTENSENNQRETRIWELPSYFSGITSRDKKVSTLNLFLILEFK